MFGSVACAAILVLSACGSSESATSGSSSGSQGTPQGQAPFAHGSVGAAGTYNAILTNTQLHLTFFDENGKELAVDDFSVTASNADTTTPLQLSRYSEGHYVATVTVPSGTWTFSLDGTSRPGGSFSASFDLDVP
jgi:hypothetical protein